VRIHVSTKRPRLTTHCVDRVFLPPRGTDIAELPTDEADEIKRNLFQHSGKPRHDWSRSKRTEMEESMRVPMILAYKLRCCLDSGETRLTGKPDAYRFFNLFGAVDSIMESYYLLRKQMTTPFPFPMEQMNRTFLYFYIFTVPLTLLEDVKDHYPYMQLIVTVFLTYGFVGLQRIAEELDDPFGNDQNDFNNIAMAQDTFDDVYMMIYGCDGAKAAEMLRSEILQAKKQPTDPRLANETTPLVVA
jgi:Bestrophin, RFP-TM, chloride channel